MLLSVGNFVIDYVTNLHFNFVIKWVNLAEGVKKGLIVTPLPIGESPPYHQITKLKSK